MDGKYGDQTVKAVRRFQQELGWEHTGVASVSLQKKLFAQDAPAYDPPKATAQPTAKPTAKPTTKPEATQKPESGYTKLEPGDTGSAVKKLQKRLKELGYFDGEIGGNYLDKTTNAVKRFQKAIGVDADGIATASLQEKIFADDAPKYEAPKATAQPTAKPEATKQPDSGYQTLQKGDTGSAVKKLQKRLKELAISMGKSAAIIWTRPSMRSSVSKRPSGWRRTALPRPRCKRRYLQAMPPNIRRLRRRLSLRPPRSPNPNIKSSSRAIPAMR